MTAEELVRSAREYVESLYLLLDAYQRGEMKDRHVLDRTIRRTSITLDHALDLLARPDPVSYPLQRGDHDGTWPYPTCPTGHCED